jgi:hypothetical protein
MDWYTRRRKAGERKEALKKLAKAFVAALAFRMRDKTK